MANVDMSNDGHGQSVPRQIWSGLDGVRRSAFIRHGGQWLRPLVITRGTDRRGFSLVELLTVIFIIALLIAILVPSLNTARNAAKKVTTAKTLDAVKVGLEMFKNDNGKDFPQTNGYPPSFAHPPIKEGDKKFDFQPELGQFPFLEKKPVVTGAHFLPAMLMGVDKLGYVRKSSIPNKNDLRTKPFLWYTPDPVGDGTTALDRSPQYLDPNGIKTLDTRKLPGRANAGLFTNWDDIQDLPVIVDAFDQPILYYAANAHGKATNMVSEKRDKDNRYDRGTQEAGPPFYFHEDNMAFTGGPTAADGERGWDFGNLGKGHPIALAGADRRPADIFGAEGDAPFTFARYILDRKLYGDLAKHQSPPDTTPLRPVNADSYLLMSAGVDGRFGTADDVTNFPSPPEL